MTTETRTAAAGPSRTAPVADPLEQKTLHIFVSRALQKILREAPKKYTELRKACIEVIEELKAVGDGQLPAEADLAAPSPTGPTPSAAQLQQAAAGAEAAAAVEAEEGGAGAEAAAILSPAPSGREPATPSFSSPDHDADPDGTAAAAARMALDDVAPVPGTDRYFVPLRLACESKLPRIMEVSLHCIQKIIAYGYVRGKVAGEKPFVDVVMETICSCKDEEDKEVQLQIVQAVNTAVTSAVTAVHDTTLLLAVKTCFYIYLVSKNGTIQKTANATLTQMLDVVFARLESPGASSMAQKDAFLVFRSLCKLSMKPLPEPLPADDSIELRSKLLSLQLLYSIIASSGERFRGGEKFVWAIRQYLCLSLLKNGVSPIPAILQLSLDIFVTLIKYFKAHLKSEIGVFFSNILLRILESSNSSGPQKRLTIQALRVLVAEPQLMVDLFLNYDCDLEGKGIFTSMCDGLSRLTLTLQALSETTEQDAQLKQLALETLVAIADSMVAWERDVKAEGAGAAVTPVGQRPPSIADSSSVSMVGPEPSPVHRGGGEAAGEAGQSPGGGEAGGEVTAVVASRESVDFEAMFHRKHEVHEGVIKFNMKPKRGIRYLREVCGLEDTPQAVARFLRETDGLDKRAVGDYLGEGEDFCKQVLYAYVDSIDFANLTFDQALRRFLTHFWLPGEAQKIDRMMEKFAERYCSQNEGVFANADTAYVLAYSLIMLNTDAHSSQIKKKMTQQEFVNMNRGINDSGDLPTPFLESLYQAITTNEIKIKEMMEHERRAAAASSDAARTSRSKLFNLESAIMVKESQELFKAKARKRAVYHSSRNVEHARPMFEACWCALLASWSTIMEERYDDAVPVELVALVMRGFANAVHIAAEFGMATERDAFVTMLAKYTYLDSGKTMGGRNIEAFKTILSLALTDGDHLGGAWAQVLKCLSEFQRLHMIGTGAKTDASIFFPAARAGANGAAGLPPPGAPGLVSPPSGRLTARQQSILIQPARVRNSSKDAEVEAVNSATMVDSVDVVAIDRIFSGSAQLNADAIVEFVTHLCAVSREELDAAGDPQVYSLQKIVEVAYYNMSRVRLVWARIWEVLSEFFAEVGQHPNLSIAMYAVDSLRQLATKFLEREELLNYQFQREFLKPFQDLMGAAKSVEVRDLILVCLGHMVQSRARSIRSGWSSLFGVLSLAAADPLSSVAKAGFDLARDTVREHFALIGDHHAEGVSCIAGYLRQRPHVDIALSAAHCLADYAKLLHAAAAADGATGAAAGGAAGGAAGSGKLMLTGPGAGSSAGGAVVAPSSSGGSSAVPPGSTRLVPRRREARHDLPKPEWHAPWKLMRVISGHLGWVRCVAVDPTNQWYATGSADRTIKVWDLASGTLKLTLTGHISTIRGLAVSDRSPYLFSAGEDKMVRCWDLEYNRVIRDYHGHLSGVYSLSLHPTLDLLCTGGRDSVVRVWDIRTKANVHTLTGHNQTVVGLATQALEPQVISGSMDSTIRLWDLVAGRASAVLTNHKKAVRSLLVHPTEYTFCSASADNLKKWKCPEGKFLHNITGHNSIINALAINQDNVMVAGGDNGKLHLYDWKTGYNFQTPETVAQPGSLESERGIYCAAFDQSGSRLITGEADKTVKIWKEDPEATAETHPVNYEPPRERKRY